MKLPIVDGDPGVQAGAGYPRYLLRLVLATGILLGILLLIQRRAYLLSLEQVEAPALTDVERHIPQTEELVPTAVPGLFAAEDGQGNVYGYVATTSPKSDAIVGYSGPNNVLVVLDPDRKVLSMQLLSSGDTQEHAELVEQDDSFWEQFRGWSWNDARFARADGVSGATLTSLAVIEALAMRMAGERLNLKFPDPLRLEEAQQLEPNARRLEETEYRGFSAWSIRGEADTSLGILIRSGPIVDSVEGYQGPTELVMLVRDDRVEQVRIRGSYDNEPYVGYVKQEYSFWPSFRGRSWGELSNMDLKQEGIEGVSGATMTSIAVAETLVSVGKVMQSSQEAEQHRKPRWNWAPREVMTLAVIFVTLVHSLGRWKGSRRIRFLLQLVALVVFGLWTGNLLSIALFSGWLHGGLPFRLAPALGALLVVAVLAPVFFKSNVYCDRMCPHGVLQQWLRPVARKLRGGWLGQANLDRVLTILRWSRITVLFVAIGGALIGWQAPLASLEPFDGYLWRVGVSASVIVLIVSLLISALRPMAYCQQACPTGYLLNSLRRSSGTATRFRNDWGLVVILCVVWIAVAAGRL